MQLPNHLHLDMLDRMSDDRIRVLWVIKGLAAGGAERLLASFAELRDSSTFDIRLAYLLEDHDDFLPVIRAAGVATTCLGSGTGKGGWPSRLRRAIIEQRPDVVHIHSPMVAAVTRLIVRAMPRSNRPAIVTTEHNLWQSYHPVTRIANRATAPLDDATLAVSAEVRHSMNARSSARAEVLEHGVDVEGLAALATNRNQVRRELGVDSNEILVATVANLRPNKDYFTLLSAAAETLATGLPFRFISIGQGPLRGALDEELGRLGLTGRFEFLGFHPDPPSVIAAADVFCLSSRYEGLPIAMLEAMAVGMPVVSTDVGGIGSVITDGVEGRLVPAGSPSMLAAALMSMEDPAIRSAMADGAMRRVKAFDMRRAVAVQQRLYEELTTH